MNNQILELNAKERSKYKYAMAEVLRSEAGVKNNLVMTKCIQLSNGIIGDEKGKIYYLHRKKLDAVKKIVKETEKNILIISLFQYDLNALADLLPKARRIETYHDIKAWNEGKIQIGLWNPEIGKEMKLNGSGKHLIWFSPPRSSFLYNRILWHLKAGNSKEQLIITNLIVKETVDEMVWENIIKRNGRRTRVCW